MAKRQGIRGVWLLICYFAICKLPACEFVTCVPSEPGQENGRKSSHLQLLVPERVRPTVQAQELGRENATKPPSYEHGNAAKKGLLKSRYALFPLHPRPPLFPAHGQSNAPDGSTLTPRRGFQHPTLRQSSVAESPLTVSAQQHKDAVDESLRVSHRENADAPVEEAPAARSHQRRPTIPSDPDEYDFIVVGCGAAGCPLASYLALKGEGRRVLVLERGLERTFEQAPRAMTIFSDGMAIADEAISQPYATRKGVRTHVAAVMGGGTAIDLAIYIEETKEFFDFLNKRYPAYKFQWPAIQQAYRYVRKIVARKMPHDTRFGFEYGRALQARGFDPVGGILPPDYSSSIQVGKTWSSFSLFDVPNGGYRRAADVFLSELPNWARKNVDVRTRHVVERVEFDRTQNPPRAKCVVYRPTSYADVKPQGINFGQTLPATSAGWGPWIGTFLAPQTVLQETQTQNSTQRFFSNARATRKVCINDKEGSEIILSAGAINTAVLLYKSGIGPLEQLKEIGAPVIVENPHVGQKFSDRVFIPVSAFTANYADEITPVPSQPIRRMASFGGILKQDKRGNSVPVPGTRRYASTEDGLENDTTFLSRVSENMHSGVARASVRTTRVFGADPTEEIHQGTTAKSRHHLGGRGSRRSDTHNRRTASLSRGSSPIATLSRDIYEEGQIPASRAPPGKSSVDPATSPTPTTPDDNLDTESPDSADQEGGNPSRVVLVDFKNSLSSEITGRFVDVRYPQEGLLDPPRVCQAMGLKLAGPAQGCDAQHYRQAINHTLFLLMHPPRPTPTVLEALRNDPFVDVVFEILGACGDYKQPYGLAVFQPLCAVVMPVIKCFRKALATFHFVAEPKSRGSVHLRNDGAVEVEGNYLKDEHDLFDAVRGVSTHITAMNGDSYRGSLQPAGSASCPATVLNGLLDLFLTVASSTSLFLTRKGNFALIQNYLQDLLPERHRRLRRIIQLDEKVKPRKLVATAVDEMDESEAYYQEGQEEPNNFILDDYQDSVIDNVDEKKLEELGYKRKLQKIGFDFDSYRRHTMASDSRTPGSTEESPRWFAARRVLQEMSAEGSESAVKRKMHTTDPAELPTEPKTFTKEQLEDAEKACRTPCTEVAGEGTCPAADICCAVYGNSLCIRTTQSEALERQLREELQGVQQQANGFTGDSQQDSSTETSHSGDPSESCPSGDESCVLRAVHRDGLLPTAVEEVWGIMERLPAAGASLVKSFLQGTSPGTPSGRANVNSVPGPSSVPHPTLSSSTQWAATFPPHLPNPNNPQDVARYALTYMSSVWHHCNTAPTGLVVNSDFEVTGTKGLSIVDASVLNQMTRMNPLSTLLMFGIYAGMKKLHKAGVADVLPPTDPPSISELETMTEIHEA